LSPFEIRFSWCIARHPVVAGWRGDRTPLPRELHSERRMESLPESGQLRVVTFGDIALFVGNIEIPVDGVRQKLLLAKFVAAQGKTVTMPNLIDTLWPDAPPSSASNQIHRYVGELRRLFEPHLKSREVGRALLPAASGYRLVTSEVNSDIAEFTKLAEAAQECMADAKPQAAVALYAQALGLALGSAFSDLAEITANRPEFSNLERFRISVAIHAADSALAGDGQSILLASLETIAGTAPLSEPLQARVIRLLVAAGRRSDALAMYVRIKTRLSDDLGVNPSAELVEAHRAALLADSEKGTRPSETSARAHRNLPARRTGFVQRKESSEGFAELQRSIDAGTHTSAVVSGMAGVGKTTLAIEWAHDLASRYPDGQLYVNMRGFDAARDVKTTGAVRDKLLESMGENLASLDERDEIRQTRYQELLSTRRLLIILDNARDADHARHLLAGASSSFTIVTSRNQMSSLLVREGAASFPLARWSKPESVHLLANRLGAKRANRDADAVSRIADVCAGLPLALAIISARAAMTPALALGTLAEQMQSGNSPLDSLSFDSEDSDLRRVFAWSYDKLTPDASTVFRRVATYPGSQITSSVAASISGFGIERMRPLVRELYAANMLVPVSDSAFTIHDLLKSYALGLIGKGEQEIAVRQLIDHFVGSARNFYTTAGGSADFIVAPDPAGPLTPDQFESMSEWDVWYLRERTSLRTVITLAWDRSLWAEVSSMILGTKVLSPMHDTYESTEGLSALALRAAEASGRLRHVAEARRDIGWRQTMSGDTDSALASVLSALQLHQIAGNDSGVVATYSQLARIASRAGDFEQQTDYAEKSLAIARSSGRPKVLASSFSAIAQAYNSSKRWHATIALIPDAKLATAFSLIYRCNFSECAAEALNAVGSNQEAFEMTTWGLEGTDYEHVWNFLNLVNRCVAAAELKRWADVKSTGHHFEAMVAANEDMLREEMSTEVLQGYTEAVRTRVARIPNLLGD
jgi:DNA-binding SARP family transcriptional activator/tetratricopeptide (TPR) repeat protein